MKRNHKHADMIRRWLDDDSLEVQLNINGGWVALDHRDGVAWMENGEYRFKPKMIKCGEHEFPEPMKVAPKYGSNYYVVGILSKRCLCLETWRGEANERYWLDRGLCHETEEAAEAHAKALIALTEIKE